MKFIKVFDTDSEYLSFRDGGGYEKPNVSLSRYTKVVHYNYPIWDNNGHDYVDLGLPSGTLWATKNVGALGLSDVGIYFQWGDTEGTRSPTKPSNPWDNYKWNPSGDGKTFTKYTFPGELLKLEDDAANKDMGGDWHMPTPEQFEELISTANTTSAWTTTNGEGITFTSKKDTSKSIFIPSTDASWTPILWTSMLDISDIKNATSIQHGTYTFRSTPDSRYVWLNVRGVLG